MMLPFHVAVHGRGASKFNLSNQTRHLRPIGLVCLLMAIFTVWAGEDSPPSLPSLLLQGTNRVNLMQPAFAAQTKELEAKMQEAIQKRRDWWMRYIKENAEITPLPYHTNLGLTEPEYKKFLSLYKTKGLTPSGTIILECNRAEDGRIRLASEQLPRVASPIIIDPVSLRAEVPLARLAEPQRREVKDPDGGGVFGPHTGYRWYFEQGSFDSGKYKSVELEILSRTSDHVAFIFYTGKRMQNHELKDNFSVIIELQQNATNRTVATRETHPIPSATNSQPAAPKAP